MKVEGTNLGSMDKGTELTQAKNFNTENELASNMNSILLRKFGIPYGESKRSKIFINNFVYVLHPVLRVLCRHTARRFCYT
jgi:hypothetical protein